ncbi:MAG: tail fiber domain-containing protein [Chitinophagaceae bacterium]
MLRNIQSICLLIAFFTLTQQVFAQDLADNNIKKNIQPIDSPLSQIVSLRPASFEYNTTGFKHLKLSGGVHYGFITEEFQQVFPELVYKKRHSYMAGKNSYRQVVTGNVNMEELIPVLVAAIQEQQTQIDQLKAEIETLKRR